MVKPPKTMQPEAVNLKKAGRDSSKAFGDDSFVHYMARKIDMQRKQFGLVLPPPPPTDSPQVSAIPVDSLNANCNSISDRDDGSCPRTGKLEFNATFSKPTQKKRKRFGITGIVKRLKKKHGEQSTRPVLLEDDDTDEPAAAEELSGKVVASPNAKELSSEDNLPSDELPSNEVLDESQATNECTVTDATSGLQKDDSVTLQEDLNEVASSHKPMRRTDLFFLGVVVIINGYTNPDAESLQRMLHKHGGDVEKYETSRVTHIIAEQLSAAKAKMYKKQKRPRPVCKPAWITESVAKGKKLSCAEYLLDAVRRESIGATKSVSSFYTKKDKSPIKNDTGASVAPVPHVEVPEKQKQLRQQEDRFINGKVRTVGTDPNFLESFFQSSRLSFIGSYKQRTGHSPSKPVPLRNQDKESTKYVLHVDMDCFFASVVLRKFPEYRDKPVVISHHGLRKNGGPTNSYVPENSSSECATCNYVARKFGIKKGMYLGRAKELCPSLIVLHYDFEGYEDASEAVHEVLQRHATLYNGFVEQVSCDESYMEVIIPKTADSSSQVVSDLAISIRKEIFEATQCTATVGVATNKLMSKLATDYAKPDGFFLVDDPKTLLQRLDLHQLPGVGYHLRRKLENNKLVTVEDVWNRGQRAQHDLGEIIGKGNGKKLYGYCQGIDNRDLQPSARKTIGAECNYGVRFDGPYGSADMMRGLCEEMEKRMTVVGVRCTKITVKVKQRKPGAPPPPKFLGHGSCFNHSKSGQVCGGATRLASKLCDTAMPLLASLDVSDEDIRGMGVVGSGLVSEDCHEPEKDDEKFKIAQLFHAHRQKSSPARGSPLIGKDKSPADFQRKEQPKEALVGRNGVLESFILPSSSQIHMSQVDELPSPIRREIVAQMRNTRKKPKTSVTQQRVQSYRQTNVQRMLKLAEVKSHPGNVSLTQLECLPLELQMQVANDGGNDVLRKSRRQERRKILPPTPGKQEEMVAIHVSPRQNDKFELEMARPFSEFMDQNQATVEANVTKVADFFSVCIAEGRFRDTVVLLRQLRNRSDSWKATYENMFESVNASMQCLTGAGLDLGLD